MTMRLLKATLVAMLLAVPLAALAGNSPHAMRKLAESSALVTGSITIGPDGGVRAHTLEPTAGLTPELAKFIGGVVEQWRFEPVLVDGQPATAKVPMHLRLVAKRAEGDKVSISIASSYFGGETGGPGTDRTQSIKLTPPAFPHAALQMGGKGVVYLIVQVGRDGRVLNADAEQVNLRVVGTENEMKMLRKQFTDAAVRAAKRWTFVAPTTGPEAKETSWLVRVPVDFTFHGDQNRNPGDWDTYVPGPPNVGVPWAQAKLRTAGSPDALPEGGVYPLRQGATLLTPPST